MIRLLTLAAFTGAFAVALVPTAPVARAADPKPAAADTSAFFFKPNDRIVFLGDSITKL